MADIQTNPQKKTKGVKKLIKKSTKVDLTPMVDLGFLLITFFVFTSAISKPRAMALVTPKDGDPSEICQSCVITLILNDNNKIDYYEGMPENHPQMKETNFDAEDLRNILLRKKAAVKKATGTSNDMVMIIKSMKGASYKNFVDMLDEVAINDIHHYFIDIVNEMDKKLLQQKL